MKRILAISDTHGAKVAIEKVLEVKHDYLFFMGDGLRDVEEINEEHFYKVAGNCDTFNIFEPEVDTFVIDGVKVFITHGHKFKARYSLSLLLKEAKDRGANLVCFGHTHCPMIKEIDGLMVINPGSLKNGNYALIMINDGKITAELKRLD